MENAEQKPNRFARTIMVLFNRMRSYNLTNEMITTSLNRNEKELSDRLSSFLKENLELRETTKEAERRAVYAIPEKHLTSFKRLQRLQNHFSVAQSVLPRSMIVSMVSEFDVFIAALIRTLYPHCPNLLQNAQKQISYGELFGFGDVDEVKSHFIEREIESVLRTEHLSQLAWFEKLLNISLTADKQLLARFTELTQRRNLYVHNDGKVNSQYLKVAGDYFKLFNISPPEAGKKLEPDKEYMGNSYELLIEIGVKLGQIVWRNLCPGEIQDADGNLIDITFELISDENYPLAVKVAEFGTAQSTDHARLRDLQYLLLNLAQCHKWLNNEQACKQVLDKIDISSCDATVKMAYLCLNDQHEEAVELMPLLKASSEIMKEAYHDWPVFRRFRSDPAFRAKYRELYKEDFEEIKNPPEQPEA